ncbi:MAG: DUF3808 domain-containing protein [Candidatus Kapabacteria bacterium]|nr:DUF3808 domain-containing protein [Candidatus Kapabacteria bacterium]
MASTIVTLPSGGFVSILFEYFAMHYFLSLCSFGRSAQLLCQWMLFFAITAFAHDLSAQTNPPNVDWTNVHNTTAAAITELYNLRFSEAEQKCNEIIGMAPGEPRGHFYKAMVYFYRYRIMQNKADYLRFLQLTQNTISVCENILKTNSNDSKALFYIGGAYGYRGIIRAFSPPEERTKSLMQAIWDGKKGYDYLNDAVKSDPNNADAQMGFGLFNCLISSAPAFIKPAIRLAGFSTDRNLGMKQLENAAAHGVYTRPEAAYWLSTFYAEQEETSPRALWHLKNLMAQFPANNWYRITTAQIYLNTLRKPDEAIPFLQPVANQTTDKNAQTRAILLTGAASLYKLKFSEAVQWLQKCVALGADSGAVRNALYLQGLISEMEGNRAQATQFYQKSLPYKASEDLLKSPLTAEQALLRRISLGFRGSEYAAVIRLADELLKKQQLNADIRGRALLLSARSYAEQSDHTQAEQRLLQTVAVQPEEDKSLLPSAYYRLGATQAKLGKKNEAKQNLEKALSFKDYDEEDALRRSVNRELARLSKQ